MHSLTVRDPEADTDWLQLWPCSFLIGACWVLTSQGSSWLLLAADWLWNSDPESDWQGVKLRCDVAT